MFKQSLNAKQVAITAVMTAVVFVLTRTVQIPTTAKGYIHPGDAAIFFASFAFGPWIGGAAGGLGTALADIASGMPGWALFSFLVHGLEGWAVGWIMQYPSEPQSKRAEWYRILLAIGIGGAIVVIGYFFAGLILMGQGAAISEIPANILQALSGGLVGAPLYLAVRAAYPPLTQH